MNKIVRILKLDSEGRQVEGGRVVWDGRAVTSSPDNTLMRNIMKDPVVVHRGGHVLRLLPKDGFPFLEALHLQYRSGYLNATKPEDDRSSRAVGGVKDDNDSDDLLFGSKGFNPDQPRGQPENAGQFATVPSAGAKEKVNAVKKGGAKPGKESSGKESGKQESASEAPGAPVDLKAFRTPEFVAKMGQETIDHLKPEHKQALVDYTDKNLCFPMNRQMRGCPPPPEPGFKCVDGKNRELMEGVEAALQEAKPFPEPITVFRGLNKLPPAVVESLSKEAQQHLDDGSDYHMPSITSTSVSPLAMMKGFAEESEGQKGLVFKIKARKGLALDAISHVPEEREVLQSAHTKYKVLAIKDTEYTGLDSGPLTRRTIYLEEKE